MYNILYISATRFLLTWVDMDSRHPQVDLHMGDPLQDMDHPEGRDHLSTTMAHLQV